MSLWNWISPRLQQLRGLLTVYRGRITHNEALATEGRRTALIGRVRAQYSYTVSEAAQMVDRWLESIADAMDEENLAESARTVRSTLEGKHDYRHRLV